MIDQYHGEHQPNMQSCVGEHHPCPTPSIYSIMIKQSKHFYAVLKPTIKSHRLTI